MTDRPNEDEMRVVDFIQQKAATRNFPKRKDIFMFIEDIIGKIITGGW
jgi:hypothetical protein